MSYVFWSQKVHLLIGALLPVIKYLGRICLVRSGHLAPVSFQDSTWNIMLYSIYACVRQQQTCVQVFHNYGATLPLF